MKARAALSVCEIVKLRHHVCDIYYLTYDRWIVKFTVSFLLWPENDKISRHTSALFIENLVILADIGRALRFLFDAICWINGKLYVLYEIDIGREC